MQITGSGNRPEKGAAPVHPPIAHLAGLKAIFDRARQGKWASASTNRPDVEQGGHADEDDDEGQRQTETGIIAEAVAPGPKTNVLHWWPIGVRKSQPAPMATAIRKASDLYPSVWAKLAAIGAMTRTVAALLRNGVTAMPVTRISATPRRRHLSCKMAEPSGNEIAAAGRSQPVGDGDQSRSSRASCARSLFRLGRAA